MIMCKYWGFS